MPVSAEIIILPKEREVNSGFVSPVRISAHAGIVVFAEKCIIIMERQYCAEEGLYKRFPREQQIFRVTVNDYFGH